MNLLPHDDALRTQLHNEVHARPSARIRLPAFIVLVGVFTDGVTREQECAHLQELQPDLTLQEVQGNFVRLRLHDYTLKWERHTEFTRYSLVQPLPEGAGLGSQDPELMSHLKLPEGWLASIPGRTFAAIKLIMLNGDVNDPQRSLEQARTWFGDHPVIASRMGNPAHSVVVTDLRLRDSGFERMLVLAPEGTSPTRAGRISQRLLELETYRLMALRGLPIAKVVGAQLGQSEKELANIIESLEDKDCNDQALLNRLVGLAAGVERMTAEHAYRFAATAAYDKLVNERITELRESPISGTQSIGEFMKRRLSPAMATVAATAQRLGSLSERISRASALLRTRVDIATEEQNRVLLEKLTKGQELQLRLQTTVEGLSIAAISYYVVSLLLYAGKAAKAAGLNVEPELLAGALIPVVLWLVWKATRRIHAKLYKGF
ncbi:MAG: hypothetical protein B7Y59_06595 [Burkholderiales bacterium 35-55-47]|jgi:uncharacterized membrane-anchored protein|uniref:DUF3422 family protein n=1 Tax=Limnohabitans sp. TaxID=1907725 RepID=UPI000BD410D4|nr:DUF3422 domain-containing protein [Limnohabitans sp.]OYY18763.1 MAG: hypothetical protein B7Y59_06595 [Burkholderiales bacterium 35-55-47]OYZ73581.1 MAG: hypothetical protein B7Y06_06025 [Burkholderiales bacterium 24-55-52]OZB00727.1 MAG: hypothetical protein B7X62_06040 [Burkholderiales bacterium 39-55-53]HQR85516.1 DUF3422 domain-containing protein [Limnohabitans sp.]HQS26567.1 DUF3422 domain-containing protein [Limnohabitans sp.]